ncbi:hypothetical protein [Kitasatospora aureofaciens]|uniref:hypothetical protein n=1 Tax=Kitasatospora aureofaciens TaxID=1894 RepID=UPI0037CAFE0B
MIEDVARDLCAAINRHANLCENNPDDSRAIVATIETIRSLALAYGDALFEGSGWANPLLGISPSTLESNEVAQDEQVATSGHPGDRIRISVVDRYGIVVDNPESLKKFAQGRIGEDLASTAEALRSLCERDGWKPESYPEGVIAVDWRATDVCVE